MLFLVIVKTTLDICKNKVYLYPENIGLRKNFFLYYHFTQFSVTIWLIITDVRKIISHLCHNSSAPAMQWIAYLMN